MRNIKLCFIFFTIAFPLKSFSSEIYARTASWSSQAEMVLKTSKKAYGVTLGSSIPWDDRTKKRSVQLGDRLDVYKDGTVEKSFTVKIIAKWINDNGIRTCGISWLGVKRPPEYLSVTHCR